MLFRSGSGKFASAKSPLLPWATTCRSYRAESAESWAQTGENPVATILIMHGLGADGNDFVPVAQQLNLSAIGPVRFLFPCAPVMPVTINGGYKMPAWYDIMQADLVRLEDEAGLRKSQASIEAIIAGEKARGIPANKIVTMFQKQKELVTPFS